MATKTWDGTNNDWYNNSGADWSPGGDPGPGDDVVINSGIVTLTAVDPATTVNSITLNSSGTLDVSGGTLTAGGGTNDGMLEATSGGMLTLMGQTFTQSGIGTIAASGSGSTVQLVNSTIVGGTLTTTSGGVIESTSAGANETLDNVTISTGSTFTAADGSVTTLEGTITNDGTIAVEAVRVTQLQIFAGSTVTLTGGGMVNLSNSAGIEIFDTSGTGKLINVNNTIQGSGSIGGGRLPLDN
jgi:hypothetical protein